MRTPSHPRTPHHRGTPFRLALAALLAAVWAPPAQAISSYYTNNCASCHGATPTSCNGCHAHGTHSSSSKTDINLSAVTNKTSYAPGEAMTVTVTGGYRTGWVRVILLDQNMTEIGRSSCPGGEGGCTTSVFPVTFPTSGNTLTAPATPGTYTWAAAWYGNGFEQGGTFGSGTSSTLRPGFFTPDTGNVVPVNGVDTPHGWQTVASNSFTVTAPAAPTIALDPGSLNFGNVNVGASASLTTQVRNTGTAPLSVSAINRCTSPATSAEFTWAPAAPFSVNPGASATLTVSYAPSAAGMDTGCLALTSNASNGPTTNLAVSGTGAVPPAPRIAVSPPSLAFGNVTVATSSPMSLTISNTGNAPLTGTIALGSGTSAEFTFSPSSFNVAAGGSQAVTVTYAPSAVGADTGSLVVSSNDASNPSVSVALSGTGVAAPAPNIALSPPSLSFGTVNVGGSASLTTQVQNTGTAPLIVNAIALCTSPATSPEFGWSPGAPFTVAAGGSTTVTVTYTPTAAGADSGCLAFSSNDLAKPTVTLSVSGTGQLPAAPRIAVAPSSLPFGNVTVGGSSSLTFTISNGGNAPLTGTVARAGGTSAEYTFSPASFNVAAGGSQVVTVTYAPTGAGTDTGSLAVSSNDTANPSVAVALSGTGVTVPTPAIALAPASLSFGTVVLGTSASLAAQIRNSGTAVLEVTSIALCAGTSGEFAWAPPAPLSVPPGQSAVLTVTYTPSAAAADSGCLAIASNDPASPTVNLGVSGTGAAQAFPAIALAPDSLDFGTVTIGGSASRTTQVQNTGNATLNVLGISLCSGTPARFTWSPAAPIAVAPGQGATLTVTYQPTDAVVDSGCLAIASDDPQNATVDLSVTGTGSQTPVAGLDIDIHEIEVPGRVYARRTSSITVELEVRNNSLVGGTAPATLVGVLNGAEVYRQTIDITLQPGREGDYRFPPYALEPNARGTISWTLTVDDQDPDVDRATATTVLLSGRIRDDSRDLVAGLTSGSSGGSVSGGCGSAEGSAGSLGLWVVALLAAARRRRGRALP